MLEDVDLNLKLDRDEYEKKIVSLQYNIRLLQEELIRNKIAVLIAFEGWDAAGKGGNIKRISEKLDPRYYSVYPVSKPTEDELAHHYLWRFWLQIPSAGEIAIFDRSWYGRVLVERVEGFCSEKEWQQAYEEINQFEKQLSDDGVAIVKFWLHISKDEQARRFEERKNDPLKNWKITDEDWRNRNHWAEYMVAANEMFQKTSMPNAPWYIIPAQDKLYGRVQTLHLLEKYLQENINARKK